MVKDWFGNNGIPVMEWLPYSPNLNSIEVVSIDKDHPELATMGSDEDAYQALSSALKER